MDKKKKKYLEDALRSKRPHEEFNKALARTISDRIKGKEGYQLYIDMMGDIRDISRKKKISNEDAAKRILGRA